MTKNQDAEFYYVPDLVEELDLSPSRIHRLLEDRALVAIRINGVLAVPKDFIFDGRVLASLKGTVMQLSDQGLTDDEIVAWLTGDNDYLGARPVDELRAGKKTAVRRAAQLAEIV